MMMNYPIISLADYPQLLDAVVAQQWQVWEYDDPDELREFFAQELVASEVPTLPKTWLMMADVTLTTIVGAVTLSLNEMGDSQPSERNPWLGYLYIDPTYRGQGLAKTLTAFAVSESAKLGFTSCYLYASDEMPRYLKWGWLPCKPLNFKMRGSPSCKILPLIFDSHT